MAIFYNYLKGCGADSTQGTVNVGSGSSLKGSSDWTNITDHWAFIKWSDQLYYCKNGDSGVADFRDARNNPKIYFNNIPKYSNGEALTTGRIITSQARGQEMLYDLAFKNGPAKNSTTAPTKTTTFEQTSTEFQCKTALFSFVDSTTSKVPYITMKQSDKISSNGIMPFYLGADSTNCVIKVPKYKNRFKSASGETDQHVDIDGCVCILDAKGSYSSSKVYNQSLPMLDVRGSTRLGADRDGGNYTAQFPAGTTAIDFKNDLELATGKYVKAAFFNATSDKRAKENIQEVDFSALSIINKIPVYTFNYKNNEDKSLGVIAQDAIDLDIDGFSLVENKNATGINEDYMSIKESKLIYILWKAIQEQQKIINELKQEIRGDN